MIERYLGGYPCLEQLIDAKRHKSPSPVSHLPLPSAQSSAIARDIR